MQDWILNWLPSELPNWLPEGRIALIISVITAIFTYRYTRRLALNDTAKMKRKHLVIEKDLGADGAEIPGWRKVSLTIRNLEPVAAKITAVKVKRRNQRILSENQPYTTTYDTEYAPPKKTLKTEFPDLRRIEGSSSIAPFGTPARPTYERPPDTLRLIVFVKGVSNGADVEVEWNWSDGTPI